MIVAATTRLDIDTEAWTLNYGVDGKVEIREDVKAYVNNLVTEHFRDLGLLKGN